MYISCSRPHINHFEALISLAKKWYFSATEWIVVSRPFWWTKLEKETKNPKHTKYTNEIPPGFIFLLVRALQRNRSNRRERDRGRNRDRDGEGKREI